MFLKLGDVWEELPDNISRLISSSPQATFDFKGVTYEYDDFDQTVKNLSTQETIQFQFSDPRPDLESSDEEGQTVQIPGESSDWSSRPKLNKILQAQAASSQNTLPTRPVHASTPISSQFQHPPTMNQPQAFSTNPTRPAHPAQYAEGSQYRPESGGYWPDSAGDQYRPESGQFYSETNQYRPETAPNRPESTQYRPESGVFVGGPVRPNSQPSMPTYTSSAPVRYSNPASQGGAASGPTRPFDQKGRKK
eukprot:c13101_g1_i1.p1 GENE.c13101_g1_i1~~c13101_g1_i1.p1  ORF type:complete len:250 (+),score=32.20 c13101_g1_i1:36-785(+)